MSKLRKKIALLCAACTVVAGLGMGAPVSSAEALSTAQVPAECLPIRKYDMSWTTDQTYLPGTFCLGSASADNAFTLAFQSDGNLVFYDGDTPLWSSNTGGNRGKKLVFQADSNIVIYDSNNAAIYASSWGRSDWNPRPASEGKSVRFFLDSYTLQMRLEQKLKQADGNVRTNTALELRHRSLRQTGCGIGGHVYTWTGMSQIFQPGTFCFQDWRNEKIVFQSDGNLVHYNNGIALWSSNTAGSAATFTLQTDGNAVLRSANGTVLWNAYGASSQPFSATNGNGYGVLFFTEGHAWGTAACIKAPGQDSCLTYINVRNF